MMHHALGFNFFDYCKLQLKNLFSSSFFSSFLMFNSFFLYTYMFGGKSKGGLCYRYEFADLPINPEKIRSSLFFHVLLYKPPDFSRRPLARPPLCLLWSRKTSLWGNVRYVIWVRISSLDRLGFGWWVI